MNNKKPFGEVLKAAERATRGLEKHVVSVDADQESIVNMLQEGLAADARSSSKPATKKPQERGEGIK